MENASVLLPGARRDLHDPAYGVRADHCDGWHIGHTRWLDKNSRLTMQHSVGDNTRATADPSRDEFAVQWQSGLRR